MEVYVKGNEQFLYQYMEGSSKRFIIPVYQRNYDWKIDQCKTLLDDLVGLFTNDNRSHFFGSLVSSQAEGGGQEDYLIIDGQQRLTTVSLLLMAMYDILSDKKDDIKDSERTLMIRIYDEYLVDKYAPKETRIKLKPVKNDGEAFKALVSKGGDLFNESSITINYKYFYDRIQREDIDVEKLYDSIKKLEIINIFLGSDDNPQLIFESLNSTGLDLSEGDKIRNFILMGVSPLDLQEEYYEKYWNPIEKATNNDVSLFVRDYLSTKLKSIPTMKNIYQDFKKYYRSYEASRAELLEDMLAYAKRYEQLITGLSPIGEIEPILKRLLFFEAKVTRPFLLEVLRLSEGEDPILNTEDVVEILTIVESYIFRRKICDLPTNSLNKIFASLNREIVNLDKTYENYVEKFKYILIKKENKGLYPPDEMFKKDMSEKKIFLMRSKDKQYIMDRYENWGTKEVKNIYGLIKDGTYSIEHIMPQTLSKEWKVALGDDWERIHESWIHRLSNLSLTAYNANYQNYLFTKKRDLENGYRDSGLRMNQRLLKYDKWTENELIDRNQDMIYKAIKIWPMAESSYKPERKIIERVALSDGKTLTDTLIGSYEYKGVEVEVKNWLDMYMSVLDNIINTNPKPILDELIKGDNPLSYYIDRIQTKKSFRKIYDGVFVNTNTSTMTKIAGLRKVFDLYELDEDDLVFNLKPKK